MPLSEHEQRLLEQMERALSAEDPKFASALQGADLRAVYRRRVMLALLGLLVGAGAVAAGVVLRSLPLSLAGIVVALVCAWFTLVGWRRVPGLWRRRQNGPVPVGDVVTEGRGTRRTARQLRRTGQQRQRMGFMQRMEARWQRRRERDGF